MRPRGHERRPELICWKRVGGQLVAAVPFPPPLLPARHSYWIPSFATSRDTRGHFNMRGSQLLRGAARAAGGYTEKTVPWDSASSGLRGVGDIGHIIVGGVAGAALVFFGLPTLYGSKKPSTFSKEHVNAMRMREHAKVRRYVWGGSRDIDPSAAQTGVSDGRGGASCPPTSLLTNFLPTFPARRSVWAPPASPSGGTPSGKPQIPICSPSPSGSHAHSCPRPSLPWALSRRSSLAARWGPPVAHRCAPAH